MWLNRVVLWRLAVTMPLIMALKSGPFGGEISTATLCVSEIYGAGRRLLPCPNTRCSWHRCHFGLRGSDYVCMFRCNAEIWELRWARLSRALLWMFMRRRNDERKLIIGFRTFFLDFWTIWNYFLHRGFLFDYKYVSGKNKKVSWPGSKIVSTLWK